jgi:hypothetical protein
MLYSEIIAVCSEIHTKHINTLCGQNVVFVSVKPGGTYSDHCPADGSSSDETTSAVYIAALRVHHNQIMTQVVYGQYTFQNGLCPSWYWYSESTNCHRSEDKL